MDAETVAEAWHELRTRGQYQDEAFALLKEEIISSNELCSNHKKELIGLLHKIKDDISTLEVIFQILKKYPEFQKASCNIVLDILADKR